jgi:hypothetical protein
MTQLQIPRQWIDHELDLRPGWSRRRHLQNPSRACWRSTTTQLSVTVRPTLTPQTCPRCANLAEMVASTPRTGSGRQVDICVTSDHSGRTSLIDVVEAAESIPAVGQPAMVGTVTELAVIGRRQGPIVFGESRRTIGNGNSVYARAELMLDDAEASRL